MSFPFLANAHVLDPGTLQELDTLVTRLRTFLQVAHREDGTLLPQNGTGGTAGPHHVTHEAGGSDQVAVSEPMLALSDVAIADVTTARHGLIPKLPGGTSTFFRSDGTYASVAATTGPPQPHRLTHEPGGSDPLTIDAAPTVGSLRTLGSGPQQAAPGNAPRTPTAHHTTHEPGGSDPMTVDAVAATGSLRTLGSGPQQAAPGNDPRLTAPRTPTAHATTHAAAGSDPVGVTTLAGYPGGTANFLRADGAFAPPPGIADLEYRGAYVPGTYNDGDIVVASDGIAYLCTKAGVTTPPEPWPLITVPPAHHATHEPGGADALVNAAWVNLANVFTKVQTISGANESDTSLAYQNNGAAANQKRWRTFSANAGHFYFQSLNDAGAQQGYFLVTRLGDLVASATITAVTDFLEKNRSVPLGHWQNVPYAAGNFTGTGGMTWSVPVGSILNFSYTLIGKTAIVQFFLTPTTIGGTLSNVLQLQLPFTAALFGVTTFSYVTGASTPGTGYVQINTGSSVLQFVRDQTAPNWLAGSANIYGQMAIQI